MGCGRAGPSACWSAPGSVERWAAPGRTAWRHGRRPRHRGLSGPGPVLAAAPPGHGAQPHRPQGTGPPWLRRWSWPSRGEACAERRPGAKPGGNWVISGFFLFFPLHGHYSSSISRRGYLKISSISAQISSLSA